MSKRNSREYREWRVKVIRTGKVCQVCGTRKNRHAHHINSYSAFPELRFIPSNGVCLCSDCHIKFHTDYKHSYRQVCTTKDWDNFMSLVNYIKGKICTKH